MKKIIEGLKNKKVRYGAFSTLTALLVIVVLIVVNVVAGNFNKTFDFTPQKQFSISDDSIEIIETMEVPVNIYYLASTGEEDVYVDTLLKEYVDHSDKINYEIKDPYVNATFVNQFKTDNEEIETGSVIIESEKRFKIIPASSFYSYSSYTGGTSVDIEPEITNGIRYVSQDNTSTLYYVTGHEDMEIGASIIEQLNQANYEVLPLELFTEDIPEDADALIMTLPSRDYSESEVEKVNEYLLNGGAALISSGNVGDNLPNFSQIYNNYGIEMNDAIVVETDSSRIVNTILGANPTLFYPTYTEHDINTSLIERNVYTLSQTACGISLSDLTRQSVIIEDVLVSTEDSYAKTSLESDNIAKEDGDIDGPIPLVVAVTDNQSLVNDASTKLVVSSAPYLLEETSNSLSGGGNSEFVLNSINWLAGNEDNVYISSYVDTTEALALTAANAYTIAIFSLVVLPLIIVIIGLVVWLRRRNR